MRYRLQRHDGTDCSATMVPITVLRMVPIQRYRHFLGFKEITLLSLSNPYSFRNSSVSNHDMESVCCMLRNSEGPFQYQVSYVKLYIIHFM